MQNLDIVQFVRFLNCILLNYYTNIYRIVFNFKVENLLCYGRLFIFLHK